MQLRLEAKGRGAPQRRGNQDGRLGIQGRGAQWKRSRREAEEPPEGLREEVLSSGPAPVGDFR